MPRVNVYVVFEVRPDTGEIGLYSTQPTLDDAVGFYAASKGLDVPLDAEVHEDDDGIEWRIDPHSGGYAAIVRHTVPVVELVED